MPGKVQFHKNLGAIFHLKYLFHGNSFYSFFKVIVDIKNVFNPSFLLYLV